MERVEVVYQLNWIASNRRKAIRNGLTDWNREYYLAIWREKIEALRKSRGASNGQESILPWAN